MGGSVAPWRDPTMWGKRGGGGGIAVARRGGWRVRGGGGGIAVARRGGDKKGKEGTLVSSFRALQDGLEPTTP